MYVYIYIYIYIHTYSTYSVYIYICIEREREREREIYLCVRQVAPPDLRPMHLSDRGDGGVARSAPRPQQLQDLYGHSTI